MLAIIITTIVVLTISVIVFILYLSGVFQTNKIPNITVNIPTSTNQPDKTPSISSTIIQEKSEIVNTQSIIFPEKYDDIDTELKESSLETNKFDLNVEFPDYLAMPFIQSNVKNPLHKKKPVL